MPPPPPPKRPPPPPLPEALQDPLPVRFGRWCEERVESLLAAMEDSRSCWYVGIYGAPTLPKEQRR